MNINNSIELYNRAIGLMPGGVNSPVRAFKSVGGNPIFMKSGKGAHLIDEDNNDYIDYCMSWGPMILGHVDEDVITSILEVAKNGTSFGTPNRYEVEIAERVIKQFQEIALMGLVKEKVAAPMTQRELQILGCIANGGSNKRVAHLLGISEQTIKNHVSAILRKLNANDRAHAVAMAIRNQWVSVHENELALKEHST